MVPPASDRISRVPSYSGFRYLQVRFCLRAFHPLCACFPAGSANVPFHFLRSYNPTCVVWASSLSLAATWEITLVFFSSGYLDVSVCRVFLHCWMTDFYSAGFPHSDTAGCASLQLAGAFRSLARPSSIAAGQAFSVRPFLLDLVFSLLNCCLTVLLLSYNFYFRPSVMSFTDVWFSKIHTLVIYLMYFTSLIYNTSLLNLSQAFCEFF